MGVPINNVSSSGAVESVLAAKQAETQNSVAFAVAAKGAEASRAAGDAALQLLDAAASSGKAPGKGQVFDAAR